uniref:F-box domain-containing protein n=1 Tax=Panagrellus redivivus TaxID=6233 RepID=A0A7E4ZYJ5_PANRE
MPYPILTLPYPFVKRLRQLLDPFELKELQRAAGPYVRNELKPIVKSCKKDFINICSKDKNDYDVDWLHMKIKIPEVNQFLIDCTTELKFYHMTNSNFEKPTITQVFIKADIIRFLSCRISNAMLRNVLKIAIRPWYLDFRYSNTGIDEDVTFSTIVDIFPSVKCITMGKAYFGWLDDLINTRKRLDAVEIFHDNFDELFSFKPADLYDYFRAQYPPFWFLLTYRVNANRYPWIINMMQKFIDSRFDVLENIFPRHHISKLVFRVQLLHHAQTKKDYRYYCKN